MEINLKARWSLLLEICRLLLNKDCRIFIHQQLKLTPIQPLSYYRKLQMLILSAKIARKTEFTINHEKSCGYLVMPKSACSSIKTCFLRNESQRHSPTNLYPRLHYGNALITKEFDDKYDSLKRANIYTFTFVRNPFDRLYSAYKDKFVLEAQGDEWDTKVRASCLGYLADVDSFEAFITKLVKVPLPLMDKHMMPQSCLIYKGKYPVDYIGRFEQLADDFEPIRQKYKLLSLTVRLNQKTEPDEYLKHYNKELANLVYAKYKRDFDLWYPDAYQKLLQAITPPPPP